MYNNEYIDIERLVFKLLDKDLLMLTFSSRLKALREENQLTLVALSLGCGIQPSTISQYETRKREPNWLQLVLLSEYFHVSVDYLLGVTEERRPPTYGKNKEK